MRRSALQRPIARPRRATPLTSRAKAARALVLPAPARRYPQLPSACDISPSLVHARAPAARLLAAAHARADTRLCPASWLPPDAGAASPPVTSTSHRPQPRPGLRARSAHGHSTHLRRLTAIHTCDAAACARSARPRPARPARGAPAPSAAPRARAHAAAPGRTRAPGRLRAPGPSCVRCAAATAWSRAARRRRRRSGTRAGCRRASWRPPRPRRPGATRRGRRPPARCR